MGLESRVSGVDRKPSASGTHPVGLYGDKQAHTGGFW